MRIAVVAAEAAPLIKVGGLADVVGALPAALVEEGHELTTVVPLHRQIDRVAHGFAPLLAKLAVPSATVTDTVAVWERRGDDGVRVLAIDHPPSFDRERVYGEPDDAARYARFCRAALVALRAADVAPEVIHANDWHTGLVPTLLAEPALAGLVPAGAQTAFTIHNLLFQGYVPDAEVPALGLGPAGAARTPGDTGGGLNMIGRALAGAAAVNTVSPTYAIEIGTPAYGEGLDALVRSRNLWGILNGIDTTLFDPATDPALPERYDDGTSGRRVRNKLALQAELRLPVDANVPLLGMVSRLAEQKGLDLLVACADELLARGVQVVILGAGDPVYEGWLRDLAAARPNQVAGRVGFDLDLGQRIYGGSDLFLMPSRFEPCGLGQLIAMRYGSVPIARYTGGLADTVFEFEPWSGYGTGFLFGPYEATHLLGAIDRALTVYNDRGAWRGLVTSAMRQDHSWGASARRYLELYRTELGLA